MYHFDCWSGRMKQKDHFLLTMKSKIVMSCNRRTKSAPRQQAEILSQKTWRGFRLWLFMLNGSTCRTFFCSQYQLNIFNDVNEFEIAATALSLASSEDFWSFYFCMNGIWNTQISTKTLINYSMRNRIDTYKQIANM